MTIQTYTLLFLAQALQCLISCGGLVNARASAKETPMYLAAEQNAVAALEELFEHGADLNQCKNGKICPLYISAKKGHEEVIKKKTLKVKQT